MLWYSIAYLLLLDKVHRGIINAASSSLWPNNVVPYVLEAAFTAYQRSIIAAVILAFRKYIDVTFKVL